MTFKFYKRGKMLKNKCSKVAMGAQHSNCFIDEQKIYRLTENIYGRSRSAP